MSIVDLFAGPGGWDEGLSRLGHTDVVGLEWDDDACATAEAAGHRRINIDVAAADPSDYAGAVGLIASPPCQAFSLAGKKAGHGAVDRLLAHVATCVDGWEEPPAEVCGDDVRADLTLQPLRWVDALRPEWIACEQVPGVLPLWRAMAEVFELWGYRTAVAKLNAADYGVPQTRQRAVLIASRTGPVSMPEATHFDARKGSILFGSAWVSMADALGWSGLELDRRQNSRGPQGTVVPVAKVGTDRPAPTLTGQSPSQWTFTRPATTVTGGGQIAEPGHRCMKDTCCGRGLTSQYGDESVRVTAQQAAVLQSFPPNYPWQGTKTSQYQQIGNAVPPLLAEAVLRQFVAAPVAAGDR